MRTVLAFDFGASTGRAIKASFDGKRLQYEEIHRFENVPTYENGRLCWDFPALIGEVKKVLDEDHGIDAVAFDTWGVDYGLLDEDGLLMGRPTHYRDSRTEKTLPEILNKISPDELYSATGNQIMAINTLFQLAAEEKREAKTLLFMPDLFVWALCGEISAERTIASTSQMYDFVKGDWNRKIAGLSGMREEILPPLVDSATVVGQYRGIQVIKVAGHDTQCAIAAMPSNGEGCPAFLSCGTWSLIGCESDEAILTEKSREDALSNELGANGKVNYLKNISGLWLIQEIRRNFRSAGKEYSFADMEELARGAEPFRSFLDPDDPDFAAPGKMPEKIRAYCEKTGQKIPESDGDLIRCIYESLAMKYRFAISQIEENTGKDFDRLHLLGGGTKDGFLCQMTASSLGVPVIAGPGEATALGNILLQLVALGDLADIDQGRAMIRAQEKVKTYEPTDTQNWEAAYKRYLDAVQPK